MLTCVLWYSELVDMRVVGTLNCSNLTVSCAVDTPVCLTAELLFFSVYTHVCHWLCELAACPVGICAAISSTDEAKLTIFSATHVLIILFFEFADMHGKGLYCTLFLICTCVCVILQIKSMS